MWTAKYRQVLADTIYLKTLQYVEVTSTDVWLKGGLEQEVQSDWDGELEASINSYSNNICDVASIRITASGLKGVED